MSFRLKVTSVKGDESSEDALIRLVVAAAFGLGTAGLIWILVAIRCGLAGSVCP